MSHNKAAPKTHQLCEDDTSAHVDARLGLLKLRLPLEPPCFSPFVCLLALGELCVQSVPKKIALSASFETGRPRIVTVSSPSRYAAVNTSTTLPSRVEAHSSIGWIVDDHGMGGEISGWPTRSSRTWPALGSSPATARSPSTRPRSGVRSRVRCYREKQSWFASQRHR
jgi:hypothetical protein